MTLPTGQISMSQVNTELGKAPALSISLGAADVRALAGKPSGAIGMYDPRGKSSSLYTGVITSGDSFGFFVGYLDGAGGSISSKYINSTHHIFALAFQYNLGPPLIMLTILETASGNQSSFDNWTSLTLISSSVSITLYRVNGSKVGPSQWSFSTTTNPFTIGSNTTVIIN